MAIPPGGQRRADAGSQEERAAGLAGKTDGAKCGRREAKQRDWRRRLASDRLYRPGQSGARDRTAAEVPQNGLCAARCARLQTPRNRQDNGVLGRNLEGATSPGANAVEGILAGAGRLSLMGRSQKRSIRQPIPTFTYPYFAGGSFVRFRVSSCARTAG